MSLEPTRRGFLAKVAALPMLGIACGARAADAWPNRPVKMLVSYPAGGANDLVARSVSTAMERALNATVIVDNRSGAAGVIGAEAAAKAPPDGYTLYMMSSAQVLAPSLRKTLPYDPVRDFTAIALAARSSYVLAVHPSVPLKTMAELIAYAKANPGKLNYASVGNGSSSHLNMELFKSVAGFDAVHVPFNGSPPAVKSTVQNETQMIFAVMQPLQPQIQAGTLRALAVTTAKRFSLLPDLPSIAESGYPGFEALAWNGVLVAAGTPRPIVARLNTEMNAILKEPEMRQKMQGFGFDLVGGTPEEFGALISGETAQWAPVIKKVGLKVD
jgi:tripartite-type tricarboxylate transporter receptor subunit TctC